jgi:hypothetical protein
MAPYWETAGSYACSGKVARDLLEVSNRESGEAKVDAA